MNVLMGYAVAVLPLCIPDTNLWWLLPSITVGSLLCVGDWQA